MEQNQTKPTALLLGGGGAKGAFQIGAWQALAEAGMTMDNVVKATCFLSDIGNFGAMNAVYAEYFTGDYPARAAFQVAALPKGGLVEIEVFAVEK